MDNLRIKIAWLWVGMFLFAGTCMHAAPFAKTFTFTQPDGSIIELWGEGDEFSAVIEHNGHSVVFDPARGAYMYARLNGDGTELIPTQLEVGKANPAANGLQARLRVTPDAVRAQRHARFGRWNAGMDITSRWQSNKAQMQAQREQAGGGRGLFSPPSSPTVGTKIGLTLLIDFDTVQSSVPHADIVEFLNGDAYTGNGNNGSVKQYFYDVSKGMLTYTNIVTAYIRIPASLHPRSYYLDVTKDAGSQANLLIKDALDILKAQPDYQTNILPLFSELTVDGGNQAVALNVFYAGGNGGVWSMGLWPHSWSLYEAKPQDLGNGIKVNRYQITNIGENLAIRTFCHENGHMLCGYPDFYDYMTDGTDSIGGTGNFCLMGYGGDDHNPVQVSAYMKAASGWADVVDVQTHQFVEAELATSSLPENPNRFYRYQKPGSPKEYYIFENRQQIGRDAHLPASGIAIWHIDEDGDQSDERRTYNNRHENFEQTLVQADNQWHLHRLSFEIGANYGDANDLWYSGNPAAGYLNLFTDTTAPSARWWNGDSSHLRLENFSASGNTMTFEFQVLPPTITSPSTLPKGRVGTPYTYTLQAIGGAQPYTWEMISGALPSGIVFDTVSGKLAGLPMEEGPFTFEVAVAGVNNKASTNSFSFMIAPCFKAPYEENFDATTKLPDGWHQVVMTNNVLWVFQPGSGIRNVNPSTAYSAPNNARFGVTENSLTNSTTRLISPMIDFGEHPYTAELTFWLWMEEWIDSQDRLRIYYRTSPFEEWQFLKEFSSSVNTWTKQRVMLPDPSQTYYVAFEGFAKYGQGIHVDDVWIGDPTLPLALQIPVNGLPEAVIDQPYSNVVSAIGGRPPYVFSITDGSLPSGFTCDTNGLFSGTGTVASESTFTLRVTDAIGASVSAELTLSVAPPRATLFIEDFESASFTYRGWTQEIVTNSVWWMIQSGGGNGGSILVPQYPHGGNFNATLYSWNIGQNRDDHVTRLTSPTINLGIAPANISLTFWHCMATLNGDQDQLRVYARSALGDAWTLLAAYTNEVPVWTKRTLPLPNPTGTYQIMFEGNARYGAGVCLDDIRITQDAPAPIFIAPNPLPNGMVWIPYSEQLVAGGGVMPYTFGTTTGKPAPDWLVVGSDGSLSGTPTASGDYDFDVWVMGADGLATTNRYRVTIRGGLPMPFVETFENWDATNGWTQEGSTLTNWVFVNGTVSSAAKREPKNAKSGKRNACFYYPDENGVVKKRLITPMLDLKRGIENPSLSFWLCMAAGGASQFQDSLIVHYRTSPTNAWTELKRYEGTNITKWTLMTLDLPNPSDTYQIAFEGVARWGYGVCVDDIGVDGDDPAPVEDGYEKWKEDNFPNGEDSGDYDDPDGDGLPNIWEYITGRDPNDPDSDGAWLDIDIIGGPPYYPQVTFPMGMDAEEYGVVWELETCTDLLVRDWVSLDLSGVTRFDSNTWWQIIYMGEETVAVDPRRFYRVKVTFPPKP